MSELTDEQYGRLSRALNDYCFFGINTELAGVEKIIFTMAIANIDSSTKKKTDGKKGGAPERNQNAKKTTTLDSEKQPQNNHPCFTKTTTETSNVKEKEKEKEKENENVEEKEKESLSFFDSEKNNPSPDKPSETKEDALIVFSKACSLWNELKIKPECRDLYITPIHYDCLPTFQNYTSTEIENAIRNYDAHKKRDCGPGYSQPPPFGSIYGFLKTGVARYFDDEAFHIQFREDINGNKR